MRRVLVTGATGLLAPYVAEAAADLGEVVVSSRSAGDVPCDLTDFGDVRRVLVSIRPFVVFHAAALTDVDRCQRCPGEAQKLNEGAVAHLVGSIQPGTRLVHFSTDQVYPDTAGPHAEGEEAPVNMYGATKLAGERAALQHPGALVLRTNFFGPSRSPGRTTLSDFVVDSLTSARPVAFFDDVLFSPLHLSTLAAVAVDAVKAELSGVFNVGSREGLSKYDFGMEVARRLGLSTASVSRGRSADVPGRAPRPSDLRMGVDRLERALGIVLPSLRDEVAHL